MKKFMTLFFLLSCYSSLFGRDMGADFYDQGKYSEAVEWYKNEVLSHPSSNLLYYNLGNAAIRSGEKNLALAAYMKSLSLQPHYDNLHENLKIILEDRYEAFMGFYEKSWGPFFFLTTFSFRVWVQIASLCCLLGGCFALFYKFKTMLLFLILSSISFVCSMTFYYQKPHWAVLNGEEKISLYSGPGTFNAVIHHVDPMTPIQNIQEFNGWVQIRVWKESNLEGWVSVEALSRF